MFTIGNAVLSLLGREGEAPRWLEAIAGVFALLLAALAIWSVFNAFDWFNDHDAVEKAATKANAEFAQDKDTSVGQADIESEQRRIENRDRLRKTEELIDEALAQNCIVADYLATNGADCVQPPAAVSRPPA